MKISIGTNIKEGPWGGGNLFAVNLKNFLEDKGHVVINNLGDDDIDIILITEPRRTSESSAFTHVDVLNYLSYVNKETLVAHRFNECDERKNTKYVNKYLINANKVADHSIFVSTWLKELYQDQGFNRTNTNVIYAGADKKVFNSKNYKVWNQVEKLKIVTHHWGANWNKGFEVYLFLDNLISSNKWMDKIEFTYIGNVAENTQFKNTNVVKPLSGKKLSEEIKKNHLYLTASINEPSGNHHIEGAQCGLPLLYINSGGTPEYCKDFGIEFNDVNDFEVKLEELIENYKKISFEMNHYPNNSDLMCEEYLKLFNKMVEEKSKYLDKRKLDYKNSFFKSLFFNQTRKR